MIYLDVWRSGIPGKTAIKRVRYWLQTWTVERLSARHQTVLPTFPGFRKPLYSCIEGFTRPSPALVLQATNAGWEGLGTRLSVKVVLGSVPPCRSGLARETSSMTKYDHLLFFFSFLATASNYCKIYCSPDQLSSNSSSAHPDMSCALL